MKMMIATLAGFAALVMAGSAHAQDSEAAGETPGMESMEAMDDMDDMESMDDMDDMDDMERRHGRMGRVDTDGDGSISPEEFSEMGIGDLVTADADGNGELSVEEIHSAIEARRKERMAERMMRRYDVDGDGKITIAELEDRQDKRFALLDANSDGSVSREELRQMHRMMGSHMGGHWGGHRGGFDKDDRHRRGGHHGWRD